MFKNYLKIAFRNFYYNKTQTVIKVTGFALALSVTVAIFSWIRHELSYDSFNKDADRIYRIILNDQTTEAPPGFKKIFDEIPGIEYSTRLLKSDFLGQKQKISNGNKTFANDEIYYSDDDFFNIFTFPLLQGNPETVLDKPNAAVITQSTAFKYFSNENPIGKTLLLSDSKELEITGIIKDVPENSHFHFDILISLKNHVWWENFNKINFGNSWIFPTYIKIAEQSNIVSITHKIKKTILSYPYAPENINFQPLKDIHLHSSYFRDLEPNGDIKYVYLFATIGILILLISCINYINLTVAQSVNRLKEIGILKVIGAVRKQLILRFIGESVIISLISFILSLALLEILNPLFNSFIGSRFFYGIFNEIYIIILTFIFTLFIGILTGFMPAVLLTKNSITNSLKSGFSTVSNRSKFRGTLVIVQFCISIMLLICSLIIFKQMQYIKNKKLGYNKDQVIVLNLGHDRIVNNIQVLKKSLAQYSNIKNVTACSQLPTDIKTSEGINTKDGKRYEAYYISVDKDFFRTLDIKIKKGKEQIENLTQANDLDIKNFKNRFVVNQRLLNSTGIKIENIDQDPLIIRHGNMQPGPIIGVVDDFHFESLHNPIRPLVFEFNPLNQWNNTYLLIKTNSKDIKHTIEYIKNEWDSIAEGLPFDFNFLNDQYNALYVSETRTSHLFAVFTAVSVFIIMLGLLGLITHIVNQKTKELGIRKVLGASVGNILFLLSKKIIIWVTISNLIAWPISWYFINTWLHNFAYRINIGWWSFVLSAVIALGITLLTISIQAIKAATANPVESLRYE